MGEVEGSGEFKRLVGVRVDGIRHGRAQEIREDLAKEGMWYLNYGTFSTYPANHPSMFK